MKRILAVLLVVLLGRPAMAGEEKQKGSPALFFTAAVLSGAGFVYAARSMNKARNAVRSLDGSVEAYQTANTLTGQNAENWRRYGAYLHGKSFEQRRASRRDRLIGTALLGVSLFPWAAFRASYDGNTLNVRREWRF